MVYEYCRNSIGTSRIQLISVNIYHAINPL